MRSLGTNPQQGLGLWAHVAPTGVCGQGFICCSLQDDLAIPCFLELSHCLLGAPAINNSWMGARDVFFLGRSPNLAVKHLTIKHGTPGQGQGQREGICWLCIVCTLCALLRATPFPLAFKYFILLKVIYEMQLSAIHTKHSEQCSSHAQIFCPHAQLSCSVTL